MITKEQYLAEPCKVSSIPYWKAKSIAIPEHMKILHHEDYSEIEYQHYIDEPYFRLYHNLQDLSAPTLPKGYSRCEANIADFVAHINSCYDSICISEAELQCYAAHPVYDATLWLAIKDNRTGTIAATGIAELDTELGEGILEWIQVSESCRGCGLGRYIVAELLWRMVDKASFATVSGMYNNPSNPEKLYRRCGFYGSDVWHILRKENS